jgi:MFS family permease
MANAAVGSARPSDVRRSARRAAAASTIGTTIEWYDFLLYGTAAATVFPKVFFPDVSPAVGVLASFGTQFVGFAARPLGAMIFGHWGDRVGRKTTLIATLLFMGIGTGLIGLLPTYASIGLAAPILLTVLRAFQGIGVGGEWGGSVLLSMEWTKRKRHGLSASWPQLGIPFGLLLSTGAVKLFTHAYGEARFDSFGWRVPFLLGFVLIGVGLYVRLRVEESPQFSAVQKSGDVRRLPLLDVLRRNPLEVALTALVRMAEQAPFYLFVTFVLSYGTDHLGLSRDSLLSDTMIAAAIGVLTIPVASMLSDRFGRKRVYGTGVVLMAVIAFPYYGLLNTKNSGLVLLAVVVSLFAHDIMYGPQAALIAETFGTEIRYTGARLGYQMASVVAGGPAPLLAAAIISHYGNSTGVSVYILACAAISLAALLLLPRAAADRERDIVHEVADSDADRGAVLAGGTGRS